MTRRMRVVAVNKVRFLVSGRPYTVVVYDTGLSVYLPTRTGFECFITRPGPRRFTSTAREWTEDTLVELLWGES